MPGSRRGFPKGMVAPRPILELVMQPIYECRRLEFPTTRFLMRPETLDLFRTNLMPPKALRNRKREPMPYDDLSYVGPTDEEDAPTTRGSLDEPHQFDLYGISARMPEEDEAARAYLNLHAMLKLELGLKNYLHIPLRYALDAIIGLTVMEEMEDEDTGRTYVTGRQIPLHIPSCQEFHAEVICHEPIPDAIRERPPLLDVAIWGKYKREVC